MTNIKIPVDRAFRHGGENFHVLGRKLAETLELWGGLKRTDTVLDIGCGPGRVAIGVGERFAWSNQYLGLDVIKKDIRICHREITSLHRNFQFKHLDVENRLYNPRGRTQPEAANFPCEEGSTDFAFATSVFTHMLRAGVERYLQETHRSLRTSGAFLSTWFLLDEEIAPQLANGKARFQFENAQPDGTRTESAPPEKAVAFPRALAEQLIEEAGFQVEALHRGAWSRLSTAATARHSQDWIVCSKQ